MEGISLYHFYESASLKDYSGGDRNGYEWKEDGR